MKRVRCSAITASPHRLESLDNFTLLKNRESETNSLKDKGGSANLEITGLTSSSLVSLITQQQLVIVTGRFQSHRDLMLTPDFINTMFKQSVKIIIA